jgi:PKD repeat protein
VNFNATATPAQNSQNLGVLMDDDPAFGSPTTLGNIPNFNIPTGSVASGNTTVTIPAGTTPGTYYISVQNLTTPSLNWDSVQIQVIGLPNAIAINGPSPVCAGSLGNVYSLATTPPAGTSVTWNVTGATNFTPNGNSVTVNWNTTVGTGVVTATLTNSCGSTPVTFNVTKIDPEISLALTGNQSVCSGSVVPYTVGAAQPGVSYNWTVTGGTVAPSTGNAVNITWTQLGTQTIKVRATHQCGDLDSLTLTVIVTGPPTTPVITGPTTLCVGAQGTLAVTNQPGSTVTWTQLPGGTTTFNPLPATGTLATISAPSAGTGTIQVSVANACGNQTATINVQTSNTFDFDSVYGPSILCDTVTLPTLYTGPFISGASYSWNIGGQVSSTVTGPLGNGVLIVWDPNAPVRLVQLTITTSCGVASRDKQVTMVNCSNVGIDLLSVSGTVCFQGSINATFDTTGLFLAGNVFTLEASNDGFNSVVIPLASQSSLNFSGVVLPAGITAGSWELRVVSSTPSAISDVMAMTVVAPPTADAITSSMGAFPMIFCDSYSSLPLTMVNATPVASIQWLQSADSTQAFSPVANGSGVGSVSVSGSSTTFYTAVLDNGFCPAVVADTVKVIVVPRPAVNYSVQPQTVCVGAPVQFDILTPAAQYTALAWDFEDDGTVDNNASTSVQHTYPGVGTYLSRLTLSTNLAGCDATDTVSIYVVEPPTVVFGAQAPYCVGQAITFTDSTVGANEWAWSFGDGATANPATTTTTHSYTQAGTYTVTLTVNASSCGATDSRTIVVNAVPDASFSAAPTELILPDQATTTLTYTGGSANITEYAWVLPVNDTVRGANLTSTTWTATEGGIFTLMLRVTNAGGCIDTASLVVRADEKEALFIPNVFTPNGDGTNEALRLRLTGIREL